MGKTSKVLLTIGFLVGSASVLMAAVSSGPQVFNVSATVPAPTSISISVNSVNATTNANTVVSNGALSFDPLTLNHSGSNYWYSSDHFFTIVAAPGGGAGGSTSAVVAYSEGTNPNAVTGGTQHGLGYKSTITYAYQVGNTPTVMTTHPKAKLIDLATPVNVSAADTNGGALVLYVGLTTGTSDPAGSEQFTPGDKTGSYTGQLTLTVTVS